MGTDPQRPLVGMDYIRAFYVVEHEGEEFPPAKLKKLRQSKSSRASRTSMDGSTNRVRRFCPRVRSERRSPTRSTTGRSWGALWKTSAFASITIAPQTSSGLSRSEEKLRSSTRQKWGNEWRRSSRASWPHVAATARTPSNTSGTWSAGCRLTRPGDSSTSLLLAGSPSATRRK